MHQVAMHLTQNDALLNAAAAAAAAVIASRRLTPTPREEVLATPALFASLEQKLVAYRVHREKNDAARKFGIPHSAPALQSKPTRTC